jgi:hypothetical protein
VGVLAAGTLLAGCGDTASRDLCTQWDQVQATVEQIRGIDPTTVTSGEIRASVEEFQDQLDQLQAVAEGKLDSRISTLREAVNDLVRSAVEAGEDALDTARPMIEDALEEVREAYAVLELMAQNECAS